MNNVVFKIIPFALICLFFLNTGQNPLFGNDPDYVSNISKFLENYMLTLAENGSAIELEVTDFTESNDVKYSGLETNRIKNIMDGKLILQSVMHAPKEILIVCKRFTFDEIFDMISIIRKIRYHVSGDIFKTLKVRLIPSDSKMIPVMLKTFKKDFDFVHIEKEFNCTSIWIQDMCEISSIVSKNGKEYKPLYIDIRHEEEMAYLPEMISGKINGNYITLDGLETELDANSGGNIEATPDNILLLGNEASKKLYTFFYDHGYQDRMFTVETKWLNVGHVDEIVTFLPTNKSNTEFIVILPDPAGALKILRSISSSQMEKRVSEMLSRIYNNRKKFMESFDNEENKTIEDMIMNLVRLHSHLRGYRSKVYTKALLTLRANNIALEHLKKMKKQLIQIFKKVNGPKTQIRFVHIPVLFDMMPDGTITTLLPNPINMISLYEHALVPDPLLPEFRSVIKKRLSFFDISVHYINTTSFHLLGGQIHCATLVVRDPGKKVLKKFILKADLNLAK